MGQSSSVQMSPSVNASQRCGHSFRIVRYGNSWKSTFSDSLIWDTSPFKGYVCPGFYVHLEINQLWWKMQSQKCMWKVNQDCRVLLRKKLCNQNITVTFSMVLKSCWFSLAVTLQLYFPRPFDSKWAVTCLILRPKWAVLIESYLRNIL